jgi:hypothetical protein
MTDHHDDHHGHDGAVEDHDRGPSHDLQHPRHRRALLLGSPGTAVAADAVAEIPSETAGPYPGDGSNGPDALSESGIVRRDIRRQRRQLHDQGPGPEVRVQAPARRHR